MVAKLTAAPTPLLGPYPVGCVVELRSGGPAMTVAGWENSLWPEGVGDGSGVRCLWFIQGARRAAVFPVATLRRAARPVGKARAATPAVARGNAAAASPKPLATPSARD